MSAFSRSSTLANRSPVIDPRQDYTENGIHFDTWPNRLTLIFFGIVFTIVAILIAISFVLLALETNVSPPGGKVAVHHKWYAKTNKDTRAGAEEFESKISLSQETSGKTKTKEINNWIQQVMSKGRLNDAKKKTTMKTTMRTTVTTTHELTSAAACGEQADVIRPQRSYISLSGTTLVASPSERSLASSSRFSEELALPD